MQYGLNTEHRAQHYSSLLKEHVAEIERLKADLLAVREKNGIFLSEETWTQLTAEQELRQTEFEEAKKQVEIVESQMQAVREEFDQSIALLMKRDFFFPYRFVGPLPIFLDCL